MLRKIGWLHVWFVATIGLWAWGGYFYQSEIYDRPSCFKLVRLNVDNTLLVHLKPAERKKLIAVWKEAKKPQCIDRISPMVAVLEKGLETGHITEIIVEASDEQIPQQLIWQIVWTKDWTRQMVLDKIENNNRSIRLFMNQNILILFIVSPFLLAVAMAMLKSLFEKVRASLKSK
jgi:hypothetical protein